MLFAGALADGARSRFAPGPPHRWDRRILHRPGQPEASVSDSLEVLSLVTRIMVMSETLSLAAVKARFSELVDRVQRQQDRIVVTRNGKPAAVLISAEDLESLEETLAVMSDRSIAAQSARARRRPRRASRRRARRAARDLERGAPARNERRAMAAGGDGTGAP